MNRLTTKYLRMNAYEGLCKRIGICVIIQLITIFNLATANDFNGKHLSVIQNSLQQMRNLSGIVVDEKGEPVIGANVSIKGTTVGTITDFNGQFSLENVSDKAILLISYIGYLSQEIEVGNKAVFNIILKEDTQKLEEVIVVGYGTQRKRDLTGAISSVKTEELPKANSVSVGQMLSGQVAGLKVMQTSAQPGGNIEFRVRGNASVNASNEPLIIIDGIPSSGGAVEENSHYGGGKKSTLNSINPNDIASIEVLKDASSTAIYGARAANGEIGRAHV